MGLSSKRKRALKRLRSNASEVWEQQKAVLDQASEVLRQASRQAAQVGREDVVPRVKDAVDNRIRPAVASGISATRSAAGTARDRVVGEVLPAVASAIGSAVAVLETAKDPRVRAVAGRVGKTVSKAGAKVGVTTAKSAGPGRYILIGIGVVAFAGAAYAAWQTLRADDELWVADEVLDDDEEPTPAM